MASESRDCVVVGGGPAGSTFAAIVAKYAPHLRVTLLEKDHFPRWHIGESLIPVANSVLRDLEVHERLRQAGTVKKVGVVFVWGQDRVPWNADYLEIKDVTAGAARSDVIDVMGQDFGSLIDTRAEPGAPIVGFNVRRSVFDKLLLDQARAFGADVREGVTVTEVVRDADDRVIGVRHRDEAGQTGHIAAPFVFDASGLGSLLSRGDRERDPRMNNYAVYGYLTGAEWKVTYNGTHEYTTVFVVTVEQGWLWYFPIAEEVMSVGVVTNTAHFKDRLRDIDLESFFWEQIRSCPELETAIAKAELRTDILPDGKRVAASQDWSQWSRQTVGPGWAAAGDAAMFIDPVLSTGLTLALLSAHRAAYTFVTANARPEFDADALWRAYAGFARGEAAAFLRLARHFYANNRATRSWWWEAQSLLNESGRLDLEDSQAFVLAIAGFFPTPRAIGPEVVAPLMSRLADRKSDIAAVDRRPSPLSLAQIEGGHFEVLAPFRLDLQTEPALKGDNKGQLEVYHDLVTDHPEFLHRLAAAPCRIAPAMAPVVVAMNISQAVADLLARAPSLLPPDFATAESIRSSTLDILRVAAIKGLVRIDAA